MTGLPPVAERTLDRTFGRALREVPDKPAYIESDGTEWSYADTLDRSLRVAGGLVALGVEELEGVALMMDNSFDLLTTAFALGLTRRVQVPINTAYKGNFLAHVLRDCGARVVVIEACYAERLAAVAEEVPGLEVAVVHGGEAPGLAGTRLRVVAFADAISDRRAPLQNARPADLMAIMYTSGTTGLSKGVEISHAHAYTYASREDAARPRSDDRILVMLPMFHLAGQWYGAYQSLIAQATCVIQPAFSVSKFWGWIRDFGITETVMLGAVAELLQQAEPRPDDAHNPLTLAVMAPLASDIDRFRERFGLEVGAVYGMSEIGAVMFSEPEEVVPAEAGRARAGYTLRLVDEAGHEVGRGVAGELIVRPDSPLQVMRGYHGLPEKTAQTLVDGWVRTGDIFTRDAEGHFYFVDRLKDALRRRGENISSFEVEKTLNEYPDIAESAVVAVPSDLGEDEIKAVVVPRAGHEIDLVALTLFIAKRMPHFMVPRYFEVAPVLPKTPTQKVQKHLLREPLSEHVWDREAAGIRIDRRS